MDDTRTLARARAVLARILHAGVPHETDGTDAVVAALRAVSGPITMLNLDVGRNAPRLSSADGPLTGFSVVDDRGRLVGELLFWIEDGRPSTLEYAWYTDEPPHDLPEPQRILIRST